MPATVAIPLITAGASAATSLVGAKMASNASKKAAETQERAAGRAQVDTRRATGDALSYIDRMRSGGGVQAQPPASQSYLSGLLGIPRPQMPTNVPPMGGGQYGAMFGAPGGAPAGPMAQPRGGGLVMLEAPNGQRKQVPAEQAEHFISRGARRVG